MVSSQPLPKRTREKSTEKSGRQKELSNYPLFFLPSHSKGRFDDSPALEWRASSDYVIGKLESRSTRSEIPESGQDANQGRASSEPLNQGSPPIKFATVISFDAFRKSPVQRYLGELQESLTRVILNTSYSSVRTWLLFEANLRADKVSRVSLGPAFWLPREEPTAGSHISDPQTLYYWQQPQSLGRGAEPEHTSSQRSYRET